MDALSRILANIQVVDGCWLWQRGLNSDGYAQMRLNRRRPMVHRVSYEIHIGPIPPGLVLDHLCRRRSCVNPAHLEPVTDFENVHRGIGPAAVNAAKEYCHNGHALDEANTYVYVRDGKTFRHCRKCQQQRRSRHEAQLKAARGPVPMERSCPCGGTVRRLSKFSRWPARCDDCRDAGNRVANIIIREVTG